MVWMIVAAGCTIVWMIVWTNVWTIVSTLLWTLLTWALWATRKSENISLGPEGD